MKKKMTLITILFAMTGCGLAKQQMCGPLDAQIACHTFFGDESERLDRVESRVSELEKKADEQKANLTYLMTLNSNSQQGLQALQEQIDSVYLELADVIAELNGMTDVRIIDPCPTVQSTSHKEMLMVIGDKTLAYFQSGDKRFLTVLTPGVSYRTTDARACVFSL